ncbi:monocarboxylate transporter 13-like isoform X2 [Acanthaster planci]|nr:monocarboxylate transporter 13-like isoform X2 [Acanthaster planci]
MALALGTAFNYSILFLSFLQEFKSSAALTGWVGSIANGLLCSGSPVSVLLIRYLGHRPTNLLGSVLYCGGFILTAFMSALGYTFLTFGLLVGLGTNFVFQSVCSVLLEWFPGENCSRATALALLGPSIGMLVFAPVMNALIAAYSWRKTLIIIGVGNLLVSLVHGAFITLPAQTAAPTTGDAKDGHLELSETPAKETEAALEPETVTETDCRQSPKLLGLVRILLRVDTWLWVLCLTLGNLGWSFIVVSYASFMEHDLRFTRENISLAIALFAVGEIVGKAGLSLVSDHLPCLKLYVVLAGSVLGGLASGLMTLLSALPSMLAVSFFLGFFRAGSYGMPLAAAMEIFGEYGADAVSTLVLMPWGFGVFIGAPLSGGLYDLTGDYTVSLLVITGVFLLSAVGAAAIPIKKRLQQTTPTIGRTINGTSIYMYYEEV